MDVGNVSPVPVKFLYQDAVLLAVRFFWVMSGVCCAIFLRQTKISEIAVEESVGYDSTESIRR